MHDRKEPSMDKKIQIYNINGKTYHSLEEVPPELRAFVEDKNGDGMPDFAEGASTTHKVEMNTSFNVNGKSYSSFDELPPEIKMKLQNSLNKHPVAAKMAAKLVPGLDKMMPEAGTAPTIEHIDNPAEVEQEKNRRNLLLITLATGVAILFVLWQIGYL